MRISDWSSDVCSSDLFREIAQRPGDFALVGVTGALTVENGRITRAGIAWFGMGPPPMKARQAEAALIGQEIATLDARAIAELAIGDTAPFDDLHAPPESLRTVARRPSPRAPTEALADGVAAWARIGGTHIQRRPTQT